MKRNNKKIIAVLPAYNAKKTVDTVLRNLPKGVFSDIIVSDDCSGDKTFEYVACMGHITCIQTPCNLGYGGNVKYCLSKALEMGAQVIVEIHPDDEYEADGIIPALAKVNQGADLVLGNRFAANSSGMYLWKIIGTRALSFIDNLLLGRTSNSIPDLHQGFRVYTRKLLESVDYRRGENDFLFSFQIIIQAIYADLRIASVPVSTRYTGSKRGAPSDASIRYAWGTFSVIFLYWMSKLGLSVALFHENGDKLMPVCPTCRNAYLVSKVFTKKEGNIYYCQGCGNGFLYPVPVDMSPWYRQSYYHNNSVAGIVKSKVYTLFQRRRMVWVKDYVKTGTVVDIGSGEGEFGKKLGKNYTVTNIEALFSNVKNDEVIKKDFLSWKTDKRFNAAVFWESLEHVFDPQDYLRHAASLLTNHGYIFVEYPRFFSLVSRLFGSRWYHLDVPRHQAFFTDEGISYLLRSSGFHIIYSNGIWAPEYATVGFAASLLGLSADKFATRLQNPLFFIIIIPMIMVSFLVEGILLLFGQSPIGLVVAYKK